MSISNWLIFGMHYCLNFRKIAYMRKGHMYEVKSQFWWKLNIILNMEWKGNKMASAF